MFRSSLCRDREFNIVCSGSVVVTAYDFESGARVRVLSGGPMIL